MDISLDQTLPCLDGKPHTIGPCTAGDTARSMFECGMSGSGWPGREVRSQVMESRNPAWAEEKRQANRTTSRTAGRCLGSILALSSIAIPGNKPGDSEPRKQPNMEVPALTNQRRPLCRDAAM
ncbi:hypothetical protein Bbelb_134280 [Branchiostoma belcheri]|nr:hypothetical protein Bbelb_134280 [Branchiostoma belcheri]